MQIVMHTAILMFCITYTDPLRYIHWSIASHLSFALHFINTLIMLPYSIFNYSLSVALCPQIIASWLLVVAFLHSASHFSLVRNSLRAHRPLAVTFLFDLTIAQSRSLRHIQNFRTWRGVRSFVHSSPGTLRIRSSI